MVGCQSGKVKLHQKITAEEQSLLADATVTPAEDSLAKVIIADYQQFAKENADDSLSAEYLFKAAKICENTKRYKQAVDLYADVYKKYPVSKKASMSLFFEAFTYQEKIGDTAVAKKIYNQFLQQYPGSPFVESAKYSVQQIESKMSNDELVNSFKKKEPAAKK